MPLLLKHRHRADIIKAYNPRLSESANKSYYDSIDNDSRIRVLSRERVLISRMLIIGPVHAEGRTESDSTDESECMYAAMCVHASARMSVA